VIQVVQGSTTTEVQSSSGTFIDVGLSVSITPKSASSTLMIVANFDVISRLSQNFNETQSDHRLLNDNFQTVVNSSGHSVRAAGGDSDIQLNASVTITAFESANSTSLKTYKVQSRNNNSNDFFFFFNPQFFYRTGAGRDRPSKAFITVTEIAG